MWKSFTTPPAKGTSEICALMEWRRLNERKNESDYENQWHRKIKANLVDCSIRRSVVPI